MVEISMSSEAPLTSAAGAVGYQNDRETTAESLPSDNMVHSYGDLRQSGEWTVVTCRCCSSPSSLSDDPSTVNVEKLVCTCSNISNIPADLSSNGSSSDVAVINESDADEVNQKDSFDLDGIPRISSLSLLSDKSHLNILSESIKTTDENNVDTASEISLPKASRLRLRLKNFPSSSHSSIESSLSDQRRTYKKSNKKSRKNKISDENTTSMERILPFLLCLILITCIIAFFCVVFAFFLRYFEQEEASPSNTKPLFSDVEVLEKEFSKCFDSKSNEQDCKLNLKLWKKSLVELLVDENQRISELIKKLDHVDENGVTEKEIPADKPIEEKVSIETMEKSPDIDSDLNDFIKKLTPDIPPVRKEFKNIPEYDADSTSKNQLRDEITPQNQKVPNNIRVPYSNIEEDLDDDADADDEYEDIETDDGSDADEEQNEQKTVESLKKQMEALRNLYDLERSENEKLKKIYQEQKQTEQPQKEEEEEETEETNDFFGMFNSFPDSVWKKFKKTAKNLNPHVEKFRKKLAKVIKDNVNGARELSDTLRKKWEKNSEKLAKRLKKLQKAWNEEDSCDKDSANCDESDLKNADDIKDTLNEINSKADWYTKRFGTVKGESQENDPDNWIFKRAKGREEMHNTSKNKKQKKAKNDDKKKKKGKQE